MFGIPVPLDVVPREVGKTSGYGTVALDKLAVIASEAEERPELFDVRRCFPGLDLLDVGWIG